AGARPGAGMLPPHPRAGRTSTAAVAPVFQHRLDQRSDAIGGQAAVGLAAGAGQGMKRRFAYLLVAIRGGVNQGFFDSLVVGRVIQDTSTPPAYRARTVTEPVEQGV